MPTIMACDVDDRLQTSEPVDLVRGAPPECGPHAVASEPLMMRTKSGDDEREAEPAQLERNERLDAPDDRRAHLERRALSQRRAARSTAARCSITIGQRRSLAIASRPIGACASVPRRSRAQAAAPTAAVPACGEPASQTRSVSAIVIAADQTVAELDEGVSILRGKRMPLFAARPMTTAEPAVGQPHRRAGADDQPERRRAGRPRTERSAQG